MEIKVTVECPDCYGRGAYPGNDRGEECHTCGGAGRWHNVKVTLDSQTLAALKLALSESLPGMLARGMIRANEE